LKLPDLVQAEVPPAKVLDYLLSHGHRFGRYKAASFRRRGFSVDNWSALADAPILHASEHEVANSQKTSFEIRYVIEGRMLTPDGRTPYVRAVRFIGFAGDAPRFVTAYPLRRKDHDQGA
jgi:hypothetical protein